MALQVCVVASGSDGNCTYVSSGRTAILIDAGLSAKETARRLGEIGVDIFTVSAVCVTHEHGDHTAGLEVLQRRYGLKLYANSGTLEGVAGGAGAGRLTWNVFSTGAAFSIGDLELDPFSVPHDAYDPVGFIIRSSGSKIGIVTDMGIATTLIRERLRGCRLIIIEANHDEQMLKNAARPWALKQRILGRQGHLSNAAAAELLAEIADEALTHVFLAHLSADCNRPELARRTVEETLQRQGLARICVKLALRDTVSEMWTAE